MDLNIVLLQYLLYMNPAINLNVEVFGNSFVFNSQSSLRSCNRVCSVFLPTSSEIQKIKSFLGQTPFTWIVDATDTESIKILEEHGLYHKLSLPAMRRTLESSSTSESYAADIFVKEINPSEHLGEWVAIVAQVFKVPLLELSKVIDLFMRQIVPHNVRLYLGYYQEKAAAATMVIQHTQEIVTIHWTGTMPVLRNKGLGFAITHKVLRDAQERGCKQAILLATDMGKPIYKRLGFEEYAKYAIYGN